MKDLITGIASILLLMVFLLQFVITQTVYTRIMGTEYAAKQFRIEAEEKEEGKLDESLMRKLKEEAASAAGCNAAEITVQITEQERKQGHVYEYQMTVPIRNIIGAAEFLNISREENQLFHRTKGLIYVKDKAENEEEEEDEKHDNNDGTSDSIQHAPEIPDGA